MSEPAFFATPAELGAWLGEHHATATELWVGFHKKGSGRPSVTWPEAVDEALCVGWIDGVRKRIDEHSYEIRFTPRKPSSTWSAVNIARVAELTALGRMRRAGLEAFARRTESKSGIYAYEQKDPAALEATDEERFRSDPRAWEFFQTQAPWYRQAAIWRVVSAKRAPTREKRLAELIEDSGQGRRISSLSRRPPE